MRRELEMRCQREKTLLRAVDLQTHTLSEAFELLQSIAKEYGWSLGDRHIEVTIRERAGTGASEPFHVRPAKYEVDPASGQPPHYRGGRMEVMVES